MNVIEDRRETQRNHDTESKTGKRLIKPFSVYSALIEAGGLSLSLPISQSVCLTGLAKCLCVWLCESLLVSV